MDKRNYYLPFYITSLLFVILYFKLCDKPDKPIPTNTVIKAKIAKDTAEINTLKEISKGKDSIVIKWRTRWRYKHDTIPCDSIIVICDSIIVADSTALALKDTIIQKYTTTVRGFRTLHLSDSTRIDSLAKSNKKWWKGFKVGFITGIFTGAVVGRVR